MTGRVVQTATLLRIEAATINGLVQKLPRFALEISQFVDERRKMIRSEQGLESKEMTLRV